MENGSTPQHHRLTLNHDGSQNRESPEDRGEDEFREGSGILPGDVARRVFGPNPEGTAGLKGSRAEIAKAQRELITAAHCVIREFLIRHFFGFSSMLGVRCWTFNHLILSGKTLLLRKDEAFHPVPEGLKWMCEQLNA